MSRGEEAAVGRVLIVEYEQVKEEQQARIGFRDNLLYATLASMAAIVTFSLQGGGRTELLLLLPPASVLLGWTYLVNDEKISAIGRYIRQDLGPRLAGLVPDPPRIFGWETAHRDDHRRISRKRLQLAATTGFGSSSPSSAAPPTGSLAMLTCTGGRASGLAPPHSRSGWDGTARDRPEKQRKRYRAHEYPCRAE